MKKRYETFKQLSFIKKIGVVGGILGILAILLNWIILIFPSNNVLILTEIPPYANGISDPNHKNFITVGLNKTVNFGLSAPNDNKSLIVVKKIELEITDFQKFEITRFPEGPKAVPTRYNEKVEISPQIKNINCLRILHFIINQEVI